MTETNHASEAAASSPDHKLQASSLPDEQGLQDIARNVLGYYPWQMQAMAREILRVRRDCPPTAEVEAMRAELAKLRSADSIASSMVFRAKEDREAWKHKADTLGGELNRIRSLVPIMPIAGGEQTTFDAVQDELQRLRAEIEQMVWNLGAISTIACAEDLCGYEPGKPGERAALADTVKLVRTVKKLRAELATAKDDVKRLRAEKREEIATAVDHLRRAGIIVGSPTTGATDGVAIGMTLASVVGMLCDERAKILAERDARASLTEEAQTAIAAMRDVGPELAKAGIHVGQRCSGLVPPLSHAEAVTQLRGERDRWREKFEMEQSRADALDGRVAELGLSLAMTSRAGGDAWLDAMRRTEPKRDVALAPIKGLVDEAIRKVSEKRDRVLDELRQVVNRNSLEHACGDMPDFLIAELMLDAVMTFGRFTRGREAHATGRAPRFTNDGPPPPQT